MKIIVTNQEDLEALVKTSVVQSLDQYYQQKSKAEKQSTNLSVKEAAQLIKVSELTIRNYIKKGLIKADRIGNRIIINRERFEESIKEVKSLKYRR
tara:strand:- start:3454 stop:3741 length:288 start_codon:yes stop_codon:yes gene_type:complete